MFWRGNKAALTGPLCAFLLASVWTSSSASVSNVSAVVGQNVSLSCRSPAGPVLVLEWRRKDLASDLYVFFFRENRPLEHFQLPSYQGRVQLRDPQMTEGDVGLVLENASVNDTGLYECRTLVDTQPRPREPTVRSTIQLWVKEAQSDGGGAAGAGSQTWTSAATALTIIIITLLVVCLLIFAFRKKLMLWYSRKSQTARHAVAQDEAAADEMMSQPCQSPAET